MKQIELLAPAGSMETLKAAVNGGANAVYLGGKSFGARRSAQNFSDAEIGDAIRFCHERDVSVYVTVNTLIKDIEINEVITFIDHLYHNDVDAVILQDIGLMHLVKERYPDLHCHASTQMTFHDLEGVKTAQKLGFNRVVLSRELSFDEIEAISQSVDIELEFFIHGALCISYSGQCLMSSFIGGRSGNRGACAQPCRKQYTVINNETGLTSKKAYLMSPKDLMTYAQIDKLRGLKNVSLKIEGRMKGADYVFSIVDSYRKGIDHGFVSENIVNFSRTFNRQFTTGFMFDDSYAQIMNYEIPGSYGMPIGVANKIFDDQLELELLDTLNKGDEIQYRLNGETVGTRTDVIMRNGTRVTSALKGERVTVPFKYKAPQGAIFYKTYDKMYIDEMIRKSEIQRPVHRVHFKCTIQLGEKVKLEAFIDNGISDATQNKYVFESDFIAEVAINRPIDSTRVIEQLSKLGGTPFQVDKIELQIGEHLSIPISVLNLLRRQCLEAMLEDLSVRYKNRIKVDLSPFVLKSHQSNATQLKAMASKPKLILVFDCVDRLLSVLNDKQKFEATEKDFQYDFHLSDLSGYAAHLEALKRQRVVPVLPRIIRKDETTKITTFLDAYTAVHKDELHAESIPYSVCLSHIGQIEWVKGRSLTMIADYSMNAFNAASGKALKELGFEQIIWSTELSKQDLKAIDLPPLSNGVFIYGHLPLMISEYCPVGGVFTGHDKCGLCANNTFSLVDERGTLFPLLCDPSRCRSEVMSNLPIALFDQLPMLVKNGFDAFRLSIDTFNTDSIEILNHLFKNSQMDAVVTYNPENYSRGNFNRGIE